MNLPRRRKPQPMRCNEPSQIRSPGHLAWIRGHTCAVENKWCGGKIEAAHVRKGTDGGTGVKPSDCWVIPLCSIHHNSQHVLGEPRFENTHKINMKAIAEALWNKSPHGRHKLTRTTP